MNPDEEEGTRARGAAPDRLVDLVRHKTLAFTPGSTVIVLSNEYWSRADAIARELVLKMRTP